MEKKDYDAVIIGSGPNGLAAGIALQQQGLSVLIMEAKNTPGGGMRTAELTLPGFKHDICSAVHPMAAASPFFQRLPLQNFGLQYLHPEVCAAHPMDDGTAAALYHSIDDTATSLGVDREAYLRFIQPVVSNWSLIADDLLGPLRFPKHPVAFASFGLKAIASSLFTSRRFSTEKGKALWAGMAAHAVQPLSNLSTSAIALVLTTAAHLRGWPIPRGGSQALADALAKYFISLGGQISTGIYISSMQQLPSAKAIIFDVGPKQLLQIAGHHLSSLYRWQLSRYRYGMGVFKVDWAMAEPVPFIAPMCRQAGTVHIGGTIKEITAAEQLTSRGGHPDKPFVLLAQPSTVDDSRAPQDKHVLWGYCHVPNGSSKDMTNAIEQQVERYAPGFRERILSRNTMNTIQLEQYNANYIGGDINGGIIDIGQLFTRPALRWSPYRTSAKGIYICSASTPPGGGVHGMGGYHAARQALNDIFKLKI